jgi:hypothetical protein
MQPATDCCFGWVLIAMATQMLAMIGETFGDEGQVMGAVVSVRRTQDKLAVWTQWCSPEHEKTIRSIGYGPFNGPATNAR